MKQSVRSIGRKQRKLRIKSRVKGTTERPRMSVVISNQHVSAQIIDDTKHATLVQSSSSKGKKDGSVTDKAAWVGDDIAKKAKAKKIAKVVLDRNGRLYHTRMNALAQAARKGGLEF